MRGISVVIPTFNGVDLLQDCLGTLSATEWVEGDEVIVVDNGSVDGTVKWVQEVAGDLPVPVVCLPLGENRGFAGAVNAGIRAAEVGNDVVVLNNDTIFVDPGWRRRLAQEMARRADCGIISPLILDRDGNVQAHGACHLPHSLIGKTLCAFEEPVGQLPGTREVEVVPFVCALIRRECLNEVGMLCEDYFANLEDSDYCLRAREAGWKTCATDVTRVVHLGFGTTSRREGWGDSVFRQSFLRFVRSWGADLRLRYDMEVVVSGEVGYRTGYGKWCREVMKALLGERVLVHYLPVMHPPDTDPRSGDLLVEDCRRGKPSRFLPQITCSHATMFPRNGGEYRIGFVMFDVDRFPRSWMEGMQWMDEIWTPTRWDAEKVRRGGYRGEVVVVPLGVDPGYFHPGIRPWRMENRPGFVFVSNFHWSVRKNPDLLIRAFRDEFGPGDDVALVMKVNEQPKGRSLQLEARWMVKGGGAPVVFIEAGFKDWEMGGLYTMGDCFVLPTSGEGWCLPAGEALACGRPVIITDWAAPAEWLRGEDGKPLPGVHFLECDVVDCPADVKWYMGAKAAAPSYEHLRRLMREAYERRKEWRAEAEEGGKIVRERYCWKRAGEVMRGRLEELRA